MPNCTPIVRYFDTKQQISGPVLIKTFGTISSLHLENQKDVSTDVKFSD